MKKIFLAAILLAGFDGVALAQCNGVFQPNTVCGSLTNAPPSAVPFSSFPGGGGGGGTVIGSPAGQIGWYASTGATIIGNANATISNGTVTLGQTGSVLGSLGLSGNTSGLVSIVPNAAAGTYNFNLPVTVGSAGQVLTSQGGGSTAMTWTTASPFFNVANFANPAAAFAAAASAGGGTVFFPNGTYTISAQVIPPNTAILCASTGAIMKAGSTTTDIFDISNDHVLISGCGFISNGTPGTSQTAGSFINVSAGGDVKLVNLFMNGPFTGITLNNASTHVSNVTFGSLTQRTTAAGGSAISCLGAGDSHINNVTVLATGAAQASWASFGLLMTGSNGSVGGCALTISDSAFLTVNAGLGMLPQASNAVYLKATNIWFDTDGDFGAVLQTQASSATIGQAQFVNVHFAPVGGTGLLIDQSSFGGNIDKIAVSNSDFFNYTDTTGIGININGIINNAIFMGNEIGFTTTRFADSFVLFAGASNVTFMGNSSFASNAGFLCAGTSGSYFVQFNRWNGGGGVSDSCSGANRLVANNF